MWRERQFPRLFAGLAAFAALTLMPAGAQAEIFDLTEDSNAEQPDIAVDDDGTAHVAWNVSAGVTADDTLFYCRVPRGAKACDVTHQIALPRTDFDGPQVVLTRSGEVVLVSTRCCFPAAPVFAVTSADGGQSFGPPVTLAEEFAGGGDWEAALGPGDFSLAMSGGNSGPDYAAIWRAAPLDGSNPAAKAELASFPKAYFTSTGFPAPTAPIAAYTDLNDIYLRRWAGAGDYNDQGTWAPEEYVVHGNEPKLASGQRGVFLIYLGSKPPYQYFVRSFDTNAPAGQAFPRASQTVVSDPKTDQSAIFRDFLEDSQGNLHAVFRQRSKQGVWGLRHRVSVDGGESWNPVEILAARRAAEELFNLRVGAGEQGGAVVGDHNSKGPIWFAPFAPSGGGSPGCPPTVKLGNAIALATQGCFKRKGKTFVASGPVKLNGIDIEPLGGGGSASASAAFHVTAVPGQRTLTTSAKASVRVGNVVLEKGPVSWKLPPGNGKVVRLNSPDGSVFSDLGKFAKHLLGFPVDGDAELLIAGKGAKIPTHFRMPGLLGGVTGNTTLRTDQQGQVLDGMKIDVPTAAIGLLHIAGIDVTYSGADKFTGEAKIELPPAYSGGIEKSYVKFGFENGELSLVEVGPPPFSPPLPIVGSPPTPIVGLERVVFSYVRKPGSRLFQGNVFLITGPKVLGFPVADLKGSVSLEFPASKPTTLTATGDLSVVRVPLASAFVKYTVPSTFEFGGGYQVAGISGVLDGFMDVKSGHFSATGTAAAGPLSGKAVMSNSGFGACVDNPLGPDPGFGWSWASSSPELGCPGSGAGASASGAGGLPQPAVKASVGGKGRRRSLRFRVSQVAGQGVTFAEQSNGVYHEIGSTVKASGLLRFSAAPGPGGRRDIVAIVEQDGVPWASLTVARYRAPPTRRLGKPRVVRAKRRGHRLLVGWSKVRGALGYEVRVRLPRDGRRLLFFPGRRKHALKVRGAERTDRVAVSVAAIGPDLKPGRPGKAKLRPEKPRRRHRGRRR